MAPMAQRKLRVLCVDDALDVAELYCTIVGFEDDMECVGVLGSAQELLAQVERVQPDVVLLDFSMPGGPKPLDVARVLAARFPASRVLFLSGYDDDGTVDAVLAAGTCGLVSKHEDASAVVDAIRSVAQGAQVVPRRA